MIHSVQQKITVQAVKLLSVIAAVALLAFALTSCSLPGSKSAGGSSGSSKDKAASSETSKDDGGSSDTSNEKQTTFTKTDNGVELTMTYYSVDDVVTKQSTNSVIPYAAFGLKDKAAAKEMFEPVMKEFKNITGVEHHVEYGETSAVETMMIDYKKADPSEVAKLPGSNFTEGTDSNSKILLSKSRDFLLNSGFTEKK